MEERIMENFLKAWFYLNKHPIFQKVVKTEVAINKFQENLDITVVKVNPLTKKIDKDSTKNTLVNIWLEAGPYNSRYPTHDIDLDCGGDTFEEAIIQLARLVKEKYGDNKEKALAIVNSEQQLLNVNNYK